MAKVLLYTYLYGYVLKTDFQYSGGVSSHRMVEEVRKVWTLRVVEAYLDGPIVKWREVSQEPIEVKDDFL